MTATLADAAVAVLHAPAPADKVALTATHAAAWRAGTMRVGHGLPPDRPARPERPDLRPPRDMPRRRAAGSDAGRGALLHALAHIELNAIDLAWDMIARFGGDAPPGDFHDDWVTVAAEEAKHFALLVDRLASLGLRYGDLPAHDGLWEAAQATASDFLGRLAVVPLVLEARGLDVTPAMIARLDRAGDDASAAVLRDIYEDEIGHVAIGARWFRWVCAERGLEPATTYRALVQRYFKGALKPPFNHAARHAAGLDAAFYEAMAPPPNAGMTNEPTESMR